MRPSNAVELLAGMCFFECFALDGSLVSIKLIRTVCEHAMAVDGVVCCPPKQFLIGVALTGAFTICQSHSCAACLYNCFSLFPSSLISPVPLFIFPPSYGARICCVAILVHLRVSLDLSRRVTPAVLRINKYKSCPPLYAFRVLVPPYSFFFSIPFLRLPPRSAVRSRPFSHAVPP